MNEGRNYFENTKYNRSFLNKIVQFLVYKENMFLGPMEWCKINITSLYRFFVYFKIKNFNHYSGRVVYYYLNIVEFQFKI